MDKWFVEIPEQYLPALEDLPGDMQMIASHAEQHFPGLGIKIALVISQTCSGWIYFRKMDELRRKWRDDSIRTQYDREKLTARQLARIYGLSESSIEKILARPSNQEDLTGRQFRLF